MIKLLFIILFILGALGLAFASAKVAYVLGQMKGVRVGLEKATEEYLAEKTKGETPTPTTTTKTNAKNNGTK